MNDELNVQGTEQNLFSEEDIFSYTDASVGQRFLNYLIDAILMQYGLGFVTNYVLVKFLLAVSPDTAYRLFGSYRDGFDILLASYLLAFINYLIYYTFCEKVFQGYTLGKLITGTRAIREDGKELTIGNAFLRSLSRLVPFEPFSAFGGHPWHDDWTRTRVIRTRS